MTGPEPASQLRALVDRDECFGFANCVATLPSVFVLDDEGLSCARDVDADPALLEEAVEGCPRNAISLIGRTGDEGTAPSGDSPGTVQSA
jgi:ferredoxin